MITQMKDPGLQRHPPATCCSENTFCQPEPPSATTTLHNNIRRFWSFQKPSPLEWGTFRTGIPSWDVISFLYLEDHQALFCNQWLVLHLPQGKLLTNLPKQNKVVFDLYLTTRNLGLKKHVSFPVFTAEHLFPCKVPHTTTLPLAGRRANVLCRKETVSSACWLHECNSSAVTNGMKAVQEALNIKKWVQASLTAPEASIKSCSCHHQRSWSRGQKVIEQH